MNARRYEIRRADGSLLDNVPAPLKTIEGLDGLVIYDTPPYHEVQDGDTITVLFAQPVADEAGSPREERG